MMLPLGTCGTARSRATRVNDKDDDGVWNRHEASESSVEVLGFLDRPRRHLHRRGGAPAGRHARRPQAALREPGSLSRRRRAGHPRSARPARGEPIPSGQRRRGQDGHHGRDQRAAGAQGRAHTCLLTTKGFRDALRIGYQARPKIFAKHIIKPEMLFERVVEVDERVRADGTVERALDLAAVRAELERAHGRRHRGRGDRVHARLPLSGAREAASQPSRAKWASRRSRSATRSRR